MDGNRGISNDNKTVIRMLSREYGNRNRGRNRILTGAVCLCIVTLTMVFGITSGKVQAEYTRAARAAGTTASACIEGAGASHYQKVLSLGYVKQSGRRVAVGWAYTDEPAVSDGDAPDGSSEQLLAKARAECRLALLDRPAWEKIVSPAYTDIHGQYPKDRQEIMLPERMLKAMGIEEPREGMKIDLTANIGLFRKEQEEFCLSGWYTDHIDPQSDPGTGYISEAKYKDWGYHLETEADILICQSDDMDWRQTEERLYQDVAGTDLRVTAANTFAGDAVNRLVGSYGMAMFGAAVVLSGMFFLIYNVMQISAAGDIRQMGLLNTIGATRKQLRSIYFGQIRRCLIPGALAGAAISAFVLCVLIPKILGDQYLSGYGGAEGLRIFRPGILAASVGFAVILTAGAAAGVIWRVVRVSCVESMNAVPSGSIFLHGGRPAGKRRSRRTDLRKRSAGRELWYMAWQNLDRNRGRFVMTVFSLFLGMEAFLGTIVITEGSDYAHVIGKRPDFLIAGEFSDWGKEEGYGREYMTRDAGEDPMETEGSTFALLYGNLYDEFSPISAEAKEALLGLDGVERDRSYVMEGAYMTATMSGKGIKPLLTPGVRGITESEKKDSMIEGFGEDVIQILNEEELSDLQRYVQEKELPVDMDSLTDGTGVMILHDHKLSPRQEEQAKESVGEPLYFTSMRSKEDWILWNQSSDKDRETLEDKRRNSEMFTLCGYLDNRAEGFPDIRQTWHGSEGSIYFLISEKGFGKLHAGKKTLYMELNVEEEKEPQVKMEIQDLISRENRRREMSKTENDQEEGEAGIFCISKSDLLKEAEDEIRGSRRILGSISIILLLAGLANYFNVMVTGIFARKKEFEVMESIGMTRTQKRKLLIAEGMCYGIIVGILLLTAGNGILWLVCRYMESKLSYFVSIYRCF